MTLAMSGATPSDSGLASGLVNTTSQVGGAIGLAVLATLATERTDAPARRRRVAATPRSTAATTSPTSSARRSSAVAIVVAATVLRSAARPAPAEHRAPKHADRRRAEPAYSDAS